MRVRIAYTVEVDDKVRRAINRYFGQPGLATRDEVRTFYEQYGGTMDDEINGLAHKPEDQERD